MRNKPIEITEDNLILDDIQESNQKSNFKTFFVYFNEKEIRVLNNSVYDENNLNIIDEWIFETNLNLTDEDKEIIKSFCEEQEKLCNL